MRGQSPATKQQNETRNKTNAQSHKRGREQKPAIPRLKETRANQGLKFHGEQMAVAQFEE
jgi:hypothetical protein